jgi:hypothetical protein
MDRESWSQQSERIDENLRAIRNVLDERDARRKAGLLVREVPPEDAYLQLNERLKEFQTETRLALAEIRDDLVSLREQMATKAELESVRDDIRIVAEGFADIGKRVDDVAGLLRQYVAAR